MVLQRIGKTVRIRRGPAAVSGDEALRARQPVDLATSQPLCSEIGDPIQVQMSDIEVGHRCLKSMGRCNVRTIRESEDLPRRLRVGPRAVTCADWSVSRCVFSEAEGASVAAASRSIGVGLV